MKVVAFLCAGLAAVALLARQPDHSSVAAPPSIPAGRGKSVVLAELFPGVVPPRPVPLDGPPERGDRSALVPDRGTQIEVLPPADADVRAPLRGNLVLAEQAAAVESVEQLRLAVFPLGANGKPEAHPATRVLRDQMVDLAAGGGVWNFETEPLPLGRYVVQVDPLGHRQEARIEPDGGWVDVTVPLLAHTAVTVLDPDGTRLGAPRFRAHLLDSAPDQRHLGPMVLSFPAVDAQDVLVACVPGTLLLETGLDGRRPSSSTVEVTAGWNTVELRVALVHPIRLAAVDEEGATGLPLEWWLAVEVEPLDGGDLLDLRLGGLRTGGVSQAIVAASNAGRYRLRFPSLPGSAVPPRSQVVRVGPDSNESFRIDVREGHETLAADEDSPR